jgi:proton-translocating NADH-quinone oxidoreductase chain L
MFSDPSGYLWLIPFLPLLASAITAFTGPCCLKKHSHWPCVIAAGLACVLSLLVFLAVSGGYQHATIYYSWFEAGDVSVGFSLRADGLTAVMLVTVTFIGTLIAVYSIGYMHDDPGYARYFAAISLFLFSMTILVTADNFILLYAGWEGVGLCSYLLIGFYYARPSAAAAARKAFLVTRIGDVGLFLGILLLWHKHHSLDFALLEGQGIADWHIALLLFCGAVGKSAQFPLHVWLPDAMEGPSPVSALIHAATMVTAGVYLVARCMPLFDEPSQVVVGTIGGLTALLAALMALTQTDLKRVLAYSTISQLGYMFLALGCAAPAPAVFHLFTHAFFKALLFLGAGSVMHAMGGVIDMRRFSGLRTVLKTTHWTFLCGAAALAGVPFLSGFWSKDEVLGDLLLKAAGESDFRSVYAILFVTALIVAALTAFYTFRAYFMTFWGEVKIPEEAGHHAHESPSVMLVPLQILAIGAVLVGIVFVPTGILGHYLSAHTKTFAEYHAHFNLPLMLGSSAFALAGIGLAYWMYVKKPALPDEVAKAIPAGYELSRNRFYLDEIYDALIVKPLSALAYLLRAIDQYVIDGLVDLLAQVPRFIGYLFRPIQNGLVQFYALLMALGVAGFLLSVLLR